MTLPDYLGRKISEFDCVVIAQFRPGATAADDE